VFIVVSCILRFYTHAHAYLFNYTRAHEHAHVYNYTYTHTCSTTHTRTRVEPSLSQVDQGQMRESHVTLVHPVADVQEEDVWVSHTE